MASKTHSNKNNLQILYEDNHIIVVNKRAGDIVQGMKLLKDKPDGFHVISGDDMITLPMVLAGGSGVISVIFIIGKPFFQLSKNWLHKRVS